MLKILASLLITIGLLFGQQAGPGIHEPRQPAVSIDYYIATSGSDANVCSSTAKCATLARVEAIIPQTLDQAYTIHVADGTYAEGIDATGFYGSGLTGPHARTLTIVGNTGTPGNVQFTGTIACSGTTTSIACISGSAFVILSGLELNATADYGAWVIGGWARFSNVVVTGTFSDGTVGISGIFGSHIVFDGNVSVSGISTVFGIGIYLANDSSGTQESAGTITVTGPGGSSTTALGMVVEHHSSFSVQTGAVNAAITISGVQYGMLIGDNSSVANYESTGNITITNGSTTPASSFGIDTVSSSSFASQNNGGTLTIDHYTTCLGAFGNSYIGRGTDGSSAAVVGNRSLTNCSASSANQGAQIILF